jgi:tetratricopeptide (TPR) repeat protein
LNNNIPPTQQSLNPNQEQVQALMQHYSEGSLQEVVGQASELLQRFPGSSFLYNILGASHLGLGLLDEAIADYREALKINPGDAKTHFNLGIAFEQHEQLSEAIASYRKAVEIAPNYVLALNNLGNALRDSGALVEAIASYQQALEITPDFAEVYSNLGNALREQGDLAHAIRVYERAIQLVPDYAQAHNNLGNAFKDAADLQQAKRCYEQALLIQSDYIEAAWNRVGAAEDVADARSWIDRCLLVDQDFVDAKIASAVLKFFEGDREILDTLMKSSLREHPTTRSLVWVSELPKLPELHFNRWSLFDSVIEQSRSERPFYEFGVFTGRAFKYLSRSLKRGFGFDTFEGLPEDWHEEKAGAYSSGGRIPEIEGGEFIAGKFEDTLPVFFSEPRPIASVINFDADLYSSTLCALSYSKSVIDTHTVLIFDEFIVNEHWEQDEYRALNEFCSANDCSYEVLAVSFFTKQVAMRLVGI